MTVRDLVRRFSSSPPVLAATSAATLATAVTGSLATDVESRWYRRRELPPWQPPRLAFPVVWTTLYLDIAVTSAATLTRLRRTDPRTRVVSGSRSA
ncbi:hypothetical protein GCM10025864_11100 [Luteimicrobium album]|uniref:Tryptophan-rich sensory protein n=1 Tax=Luteimicrobium album TaxID=1054550 RepID=A0ABQ6HXX5_9MICO|nr:TspO/MBR family protein [Luteimicrobium album]GMA23351.1 hypothetical protein GCM10025864_11100 [Luteimicrobium album]